MRRCQQWLRQDLVRLRVAEHQLVIKRLHGATLAVVLAVAAVLLLALGVFVGTHFPYRTLPAPPVPKGQTIPNCGSGDDHELGQCLPQPKTGGKHAAADYQLAAFTSGISGPDLSNNDPVQSRAGWQAIAAHSRFAYVKSVEGTGFYDQTAQAMAALSKAFGLPVGGYDFQHVCGDSPSTEAAFFVRSLSRQGLLGKGTLPPAADSEYGSGSCGGRAWIQTWVNVVYSLDGHVCPIVYTGAWWWQPNLGVFWPTCNGHQLLSWVSGYGVSYPYMPSGVSHLDLWQLTDHGYNGYTSGDLSVWQHSAAEFASFAGAKPVDPLAFLDRTRRHLGHGVIAAEYNTVKTWHSARCLHPPRRLVCVSSAYHAQLLEARLWRVAHRHNVLWADGRGRRFHVLRVVASGR